MYLTIFEPKETDRILNEKKESISSVDIGNVLQYTNDPFTVKSFLVEDDKGFVTLGIIRIVNDFKVIFNPRSSKMKIAIALDKMFKEGLLYCKEKGSNEIYTTISHGGEKQELFVKYLIRHYGFERLSGTSLLLEV